MLPQFVIIIHLCVTGLAQPTDCREANTAIVNCGGAAEYDHNPGAFDACIADKFNRNRSEEIPAGVTILRGR